MKILRYLVIMVFSAGCSSILLQPADFSWPVESVLKVDDNGYINEDRYSLTLNVKPVFIEEFTDSSSDRGREVRIIRDQSGYYYLTASGFKNVYSFIPVKGGLELEDKIALPDSLELIDPAFNQKKPNIELLDGSNKFLLNSKGIVRAQ